MHDAIEGLLTTSACLFENNKKYKKEFEESLKLILQNQANVKEAASKALKFILEESKVV